MKLGKNKLTKYRIQSIYFTCIALTIHTLLDYILSVKTLHTGEVYEQNVRNKPNKIIFKQFNYKNDLMFPVCQQTNYKYRKII